jgi:hypothetical protein
MSDDKWIAIEIGREEDGSLTIVAENTETGEIREHRNCLLTDIKTTVNASSGVTIEPVTITGKIVT